MRESMVGLAKHYSRMNALLQGSYSGVSKLI